MSRILWINPVGTDTFDAPIKTELERVRRADTEITVTCLPGGPLSLETHASEVAAAPGIVRAILQAEEDGFDAAIVGRYFDTAPRAARELTTRLVVAAPCEATVHVANTLGASFSVVTGRRSWVPHMQSTINAYGLGSRLRSFRTVDLRVHDFHDD